MRAKVIFASPIIIIAPHRQETSILGYLAKVNQGKIFTWDLINKRSWGSLSTMVVVILVLGSKTNVLLCYSRDILSYR